MLPPSAMNSTVPLRLTRRRFSSSNAGMHSGPRWGLAASARRSAKRASSSVSPCRERASWFRFASLESGTAMAAGVCASSSRRKSTSSTTSGGQAFSPYRTTLLLLGAHLPLKAVRDSANVLLKAVHNVALEPSTCDSYDIIDLDRGFIPPEWRALVGDGGADKPRLFNRRYLEVLAILELTEAIKAGVVNVSGSLSYEDFWGKLPTEAADPERIAAYAVERGWPAGAVGFTAHLRDKLENEACQLDTDVGLLRTVLLDKHRRPILARVIPSELPASAAQAVRQVLDAMPERSVLEALANTARWVGWPRHFGLPSRLASGIENAHDRYVIATFAYGCGLGPAQAARHFGGAVTAEDLSFVDRRHVDIADLRAGSADLQNLYSQFELTQLRSEEHTSELQ